MLPKNWHTYKRLYYWSKRYKQMPKYSMYRHTVTRPSKIPSWLSIIILILFIIGMLAIL